MTVEEVIKEFKMVSEPGLNDGRKWPYEKVKLLVDEIVRLQELFNDISIDYEDLLDDKLLLMEQLEELEKQCGQ